MKLDIQDNDKIKVKLFAILRERVGESEITITAPNKTLRTSPNSFSISRIAKNEGCNIRYIESAIARGERTKAEIETPRRVLLI